tara:strand:- start:267 stop:425 length:159 start_codon:yes stop_codon:yes gene_type:complete
MKPGEYLVLVFVALMLTAFFSIYVWFQIKRTKRNQATRKAAEASNIEPIKKE